MAKPLIVELLLWFKKNRNFDAFRITISFLFLKTFEKQNCKNWEWLSNIKLPNPFSLLSYLHVKFKRRLNACILGLNFLSALNDNTHTVLRIVLQMQTNFQLFIKTENQTALVMQQIFGNISYKN